MARSDRANSSSNSYRDETQAELDFLDGATVGSVVNSKALIYGSSGEVAATTLDVAGASSFLGIKKFQSFAGSLASIGDGTTQFSDTDVLVELGELDAGVPTGHVAASKFFIDKIVVGITTTAGTALSAALYTSATSGTNANTNVASGTEICGAGVASFDTRVSAAGSDVTEIDIDMHGGNGHYHVFTPNVTSAIASKYLYLCATSTLNADATAGRFTVMVEYTVY